MPAWARVSSGHEPPLGKRLTTSASAARGLAAQLKLVEGGAQFASHCPFVVGRAQVRSGGSAGAGGGDHP